jgi:hypothetical protein
MEPCILLRPGYVDTGMEMLLAFHEDTLTDGTFISSGRRLDYIFVSTDFWASPQGLPAAEVYNSAQDDGVGGLPKLGSPLPASTSSSASDHYAIFADFEMANAVPFSTTLSIVSVDAQGAHLSFDSVLNQIYTIQSADGINGPGAWSNATDFVGVPGSGADLNYTDTGSGTGGGLSNVANRVYRLSVNQ